MKPVSAERFAVQFTIGRGTHDKLRRVQALVSHELPSGDIAEVFDRALDALTDRLEKRKFAATTRPRPRPGHSTANPRRIPAHVKRAVWERDRGQCTFVGATGHRCSARGFLEYDHVEPVARGGQATVANLRLRCSPHNQFEAERLLGAGFMNGKRAGASRAAAETGALKIGPEACARAAAAARSPAAVAEARAREQAADTRAGARPVASEAHADAVAQLGDLKTVLREFGFRADEVRRAIEFCANLGDVMLEEQVRAALRLLCPKARVQGPVGAIPVMAT